MICRGGDAEKCQLEFLLFDLTDFTGRRRAEGTTGAGKRDRGQLRKERRVCSSCKTKKLGEKKKSEMMPLGYLLPYCGSCLDAKISEGSDVATFKKNK